MIDVPSNVIWIAGLVVLVCSLAFLWNIKLSNHAEPVLRLENEHQQHNAETVIDTRRYKAMPVLAPAPPPVAIVIEEETAGVEPADAMQGVKDQVALEDVPDNDDAERMLTLAWQLEVHGDFDGRDEFAAMVIESADASPRQRDRAHALLRRDSIA